MENETGEGLFLWENIWRWRLRSLDGGIRLFFGNTLALDLSGGKNTGYTFPKNFFFGVSTAAFQIEGAWNLDGKSESIWDRLVHTNKTFVRDGSNADVAADSYHLYKRDVEMVRELGVDIYRFSISWPRVLPTGLSNDINPLGIRYYKNLVDELVKHNITPMATIYHWDLPQRLQDIGGWSNAHIVDYFRDYAKVLFDNFGDKIKYWVTFNEPMQTCLEGYGGTYRAPALDRRGIAEYLCTHNLLKAHAKVYHLYDREYRPLFGGKIGIALDSNWAEPKTNSSRDTEAAELYLKTHVGWYAHPIFSKEGNYPQELIERVDAKSIQQNYTRSRLPKFTAEEIAFVRGTADFFGLNHYTTYLLTMADKEVGSIPSHENDVGIVRVQDPHWPSRSSSAWLKVVPSGFRRLLHWITKTYNNIPIIVTENGYADYDGVEDASRVSYYSHYLNALLHALHEDHSTVIGYFAWSLMDNFEWDDGYVSRFGLYYVDFESPNKTRTAKASAQLYSRVVATRHLPATFRPDDFSAFNAAPAPLLTPALSSLGAMLLRVVA
ncbi:Myrosinase 1 [Eumeta japonica]|uniref:Myrosinase 1 n=1 Tax=Eumeta variegata TaxID=151549 RepID=A0A4C1XGX6_EUMVA|nr:Myrosinase 1 [Eumeta japonica]